PAVATSLLAAGDSEGVRHAALEAIAARPGLPEPYVMLADAKAGAGDPPGDVLKLLDIAESCLAEPHGQLERNPMFVNYVMPVLAAESLLQLDRPQEALVRAERALRQRPADDRSRQAWRLASTVSRHRIDTAPVVPPGEATPVPVSSQPPYFVVSTGRCGSTLISDMLRLHPRVLSLSELIGMLTPGAFPGSQRPIYAEQFWAHLSTPRRRMSLMYRHDIVFDEVLYRPGPGRRYTAETGVPPLLLTALPHLTDEPEALFDEIREFVLTQGPVPIGVHYTKLFEWLRDRFGRQIWVERSGSSLAYLRELIDNFPGARFIHLFRDGRETAVSMTRHHAFRRSVLTALSECNFGVDPI